MYPRNRHLEIHVFFSTKGEMLLDSFSRINKYQNEIYITNTYLIFIYFDQKLMGLKKQSKIVKVIIFVSGIELFKTTLTIKKDML